jgi:hypothetical protein
VDYQLLSILKLAGLDTLTPNYKSAISCLFIVKKKKKNFLCNMLKLIMTVSLVKKTIRHDSSESFSIESSTIDNTLVCSPSFEAYRSHT